MRSAASIKGHPIHPILIAFPIGFLTGALGFDLAGWLGNWPTVWTTGGYLSVAGILAGLVAAVPGLIDYFLVVPPDSTAKRRATCHMLINVVALVIFALAWMFRDTASFLPGAGTLILEAIGLVVLGAGGWLGGILVYRNQIAVEHSYADAGKWHESTFDPREMESEAVAVAREDELEVDQMKLLHLGGQRIVLARTAQGYSAFDDHCTHHGGPLSDGVLICGTVQCPWHGSQFDVKTGAVKAGPAHEPIATHRVFVRDGQVYLQPSWEVAASTAGP